MEIGLSLGLTARCGGAPSFRYFGGVLHELLTDGDGNPLIGVDGFYLYGVVQ